MARPKNPDVKAFNVRIPRDVWAFVKKKAVDRETSFNLIIVELLTKYKKKCEKKVDDDLDCDTIASS